MDGYSDSLLRVLMAAGGVRYFRGGGSTPPTPLSNTALLRTELLLTPGVMALWFGVRARVMGMISG